MRHEETNSKFSLALTQVSLEMRLQFGLQIRMLYFFRDCCNLAAESEAQIDSTLL